MSRRNVVWLAAIVAFGVAVTVAVGWPWGLLAALVTLVVSEVVERTRRARIRRERGTHASTVGVRAALESRRRR